MEQTFPTLDNVRIVGSWVVHHATSTSQPRCLPSRTDGNTVRTGQPVTCKRCLKIPATVAPEPANDAGEYCGTCGLALVDEDFVTGQRTCSDCRTSEPAPAVTECDDTDITDQVLATLGPDARDYDVAGIVRELIATFDLIGDAPRDTVDGIEPDAYWSTVAKFQRDKAKRFCTVCHIHMNCHAPALPDYENHSHVCDIPRAELTLKGMEPPRPRAPRNTATPKVHVFASTGEAYDASQCDNGIVDGDVLWVPGAGVVAVLVAAWPTAVDTDTPGEFHALKSGEEWSKTEYGDYTVSVALAREVLAVTIPAPTKVQGINFEGVSLSTDEEAHLINLPPDGIGIVFGDLVAPKHVVRISRNRVEGFAQSLVEFEHFTKFTDPAPAPVANNVDTASTFRDRSRFTVSRRRDFLTELSTWCDRGKFADVVSAIRDLGPTLSRSQKWQDACAWVTTAMDEGREESYVALQGVTNLGHVFPVGGAL